MADLLTLLGMALNFVGALLLVLFRFPALEVTADGRDLGQSHDEPAPEARAKNIRRYWKNELATRAGLICICVGFALQLLGFVYPDLGSGATDSTFLHSPATPARPKPV